MRQYIISNCFFLARSSTLLFLLLGVSACSSSSNNTSDGINGANIQADDIAEVDSANASQLNDNQWLLGPFTYSAQTSSQVLGDNDTVIVIAASLEQKNAHGFFSGAGLGITMTDSGAGVYALTDVDGVMVAAQSGSAVLSVYINAGLNNTDPAVASRWSSLASTGTANVTQSDDGRYFISINEPVTLTRELDFGDGIPNSSDQMQLVMKNINGELQ